MTETPILLALAAALYAILLLVLFFFVVRIRRGLIAFDKRMGRIEGLLVARSGNPSQASAPLMPNDPSRRRIRVCENCGRKNALQDVKCAVCGELLQWDRQAKGDNALRVDPGRAS